MSSERPAESTDTEPDEKTTDGEEEAEVKQEVEENGKEGVHVKSEAEEGDMEVSNGHEEEAVIDKDGPHSESNTRDNEDTTDPSIIDAIVESEPGDNNNLLPPHLNGDHQDQGVSKHPLGLEAANDEPEDAAVTASNKKPKLESLNDCDNNSDTKGRELHI